MASREGWLGEELRRRGVSRRELLLFCAGVAGMFGLPASAATQIARAHQGEEADPGLARVPGLRRQHRGVPARQPPDRGRDRARHALASTTTRRSWRRPATRPRRPSASGQGQSRAPTSPSSRARSRPAPTAPTARSAAARRCRSRARSAAARPPPSRSAPAPHSAGSRPRPRTRPARSASGTRCRASRT